MVRWFDSVLSVIGKTPLIRLQRIPAAEGVRACILVKFEAVNPGGSIKDRIAVAMIREAERTGALVPGGTIIEATAGNTGVGLAMAAAVKGYRMIFVIPDKMSAEKINLLKAFGAEVVITPTSVPPDSPESYHGVADRLAREIPHAFRPNQFANHANPDAHYFTTGPEIWEDTDGAVNVLVAGMGTGGTISGTGRFLKERKPSVIVVGADPAGSVLSGDAPHSYKVEGVGEDFVPRTFNCQVVDEMIRVTDAEAFVMTRRLAREEGILAGGSSGMAVAAALAYARRLTREQYIVVILPDTGRNYLSKMYDDRWMLENGFLPDDSSRRMLLGDVVRRKSKVPLLIAVGPQDTLAAAVELMQRYGISQVPVIHENRQIGALTETAVIKAIRERPQNADDPVRIHMAEPLPEREETVDAVEAYRLLLAGRSGILVVRNGAPLAVLTGADLIQSFIR